MSDKRKKASSLPEDLDLNTRSSPFDSRDNGSESKGSSGFNEESRDFDSGESTSKGVYDKIMSAKRENVQSPFPESYVALINKILMKKGNNDSFVDFETKLKEDSSKEESDDETSETDDETSDSDDDTLKTDDKTSHAAIQASGSSPTPGSPGVIVEDTSPPLKKARIGQDITAEEIAICVRSYIDDFVRNLNSEDRESAETKAVRKVYELIGRINAEKILEIANKQNTAGLSDEQRRALIMDSINDLQNRIKIEDAKILKCFYRFQFKDRLTLELQAESNSKLILMKHKVSKIVTEETEQGPKIYERVVGESFGKIAEHDLLEIINQPQEEISKVPQSPDEQYGMWGIRSRWSRW